MVFEVINDRGVRLKPYEILSLGGGTDALIPVNGNIFKAPKADIFSRNALLVDGIV